MIADAVIRWLLFLGVLVQATALSAERLSAGAFSGNGKFEYLFFALERQAEAAELLKRIAELKDEERRLTEELRRKETELASLSTTTEAKKATRLEWSAIEGATGYSVKLFDAQKKLLEAQNTDTNSITFELSPGEYHFQVAAVTQYKTGAYSRLTRLKVSKPKPPEEVLKLEEALELLREKAKLARNMRTAHAEMLRKIAVQRETVSSVPAELNAVATAACYLIAEISDEERYSELIALPERGKVAAQARASASERSSHFFWGAGLFAGIQDTRLDFFRLTFGLEAFLRYDKPLFGFFYPQLKLMSGFSPAKEQVFDALVHSLLYAGAYYPIEIGRGFRLLGQLSTGPNVFFLLGSGASGMALQWGVMPSVELQYAAWERTSIYVNAGINFTFDPNGILRFVPLSFGVTQHF